MMQAVKKLATLGAVLALASPAYARTFTSADGTKTMNGSLTAVSVKAKTATIKRVDGKSITFPLSAVSKDDQQHIKDWYKGTEVLRGLSVNFKAQETKGTERKTSNARIYNVDSKFAVNVRNNSAFDLEGLKLEYVIFYKKDNGKGKKDTELTKRGQFAVSSINARGDKRLLTDGISLRIQKRLPASQCKGGG